MNLSRLTKWAAMAVLALAMACGAAAPALSQEIAPETLALARKYVDLTNKAQLYQAILAQTAALRGRALGHLAGHEHHQDRQHLLEQLGRESG